MPRSSPTPNPDKSALPPPIPAKTNRESSGHGNSRPPSAVGPHMIGQLNKTGALIGHGQPNQTRSVTNQNGHVIGFPNQINHVIGPPNQSNHMIGSPPKQNGQPYQMGHVIMAKPNQSLHMVAKPNHQVKFY